ncbi:MAG: class I SAM-dependent methyltransferase, partial [Ktedonobacterales bacterium]|nr:class I SAM-dependent methyltransferase [Ktedonobacterales bacterium]
ALSAFDVLYRNATLYWLASTIPFAGQWRVWQRLVLPRLRGHAVLEVGCGTGWLLADMLAAGFACQAIDASPQMVRSAQRTLRRRGFAAQTQAVQIARAQALPFATASFDAVVSTFPAPYIADPATLREIARVLRPDGRLIIVEGAHLLPQNLFLRVLVGLQGLVYGRAAVQGPAQPAAVAALQQRLPLHMAGLIPSQEIVAGPFWRAYIAYGAKPAASSSSDVSVEQ